MTDTTASSPARKPPQRRAAAKPQPSPFAGLTKSACCDDCRPDRCVITGIGICGHPHKGGVQASQMHNSKVVARHAAAKDYLVKHA